MRSRSCYSSGGSERCSRGRRSGRPCDSRTSSARARSARRRWRAGRLQHGLRYRGLVRRAARLVPCSFAARPGGRAGAEPACRRLPVLDLRRHAALGVPVRRPRAGWRAVPGSAARRRGTAGRSPRAGGPVLILARHGATAENDAGTLLGRQPAGLSERGVVEARALADWLRTRYRVSTIHSSDLPRAVQTADVVASALGIDEPREHPLLRERELGPFEGLGREELLAERRRRGLPTSSPTQDWHGVEEVESDSAVWARFERFASDCGLFARAEEADVLVVTHAGVIRS